MKKQLIVTVMLIMSCGCYRSQIVAPTNKNLILATRGDFCQDIDTKKVFSFMGIANYNNNTPAEMLADVPEGKKVRFKTRQSFLDMLVGGLTMGLVSMHSIEAQVCQ